MSDEGDPLSKVKVAELRAELQTRALELDIEKEKALKDILTMLEKPAGEAGVIDAPRHVLIRSRICLL